MKRAVFTIALTVVSLYLILSYRLPPPAHTFQIASQPLTEMTLPEDQPTTTSVFDQQSPDLDASEAVVESTTTDEASQLPVTTTTTTVVAVKPTTTTPPLTHPSQSPTSSVKPTTSTTVPLVSSTTAKPVTTTTAPQPRTVNGSVVTTKYGPVQVSITMQGSKITGVRALQVPTGGASDAINADAVPKLQSQTLQAQSASINGVSGATYTSNAWKESLQAALSQ